MKFDSQGKLEFVDEVKVDSEKRVQGRRSFNRDKVRREFL